MASMLAKTKTGIGYKGTTIQEHSDWFRVTLYNTDVYTETESKVFLDNGRWNTPTTAQRINSALVHRGFQPGISRVGGVMSYRGQPFINGKLELNKSEMRRLDR